MFGFLTSVRSGTADPLADLMAVEAFWRGLPRDDAIAAQKAVCAAIADPNPRKAPNSERVRALLAFDRHIQSLLDALLANGSGIAAQVAVVEPTGADTFVSCRHHGAELAVVFRERHQFSPGSTIHLKPDMAHAHLFDADSGRALVA